MVLLLLQPTNRPTSAEAAAGAMNCRQFWGWGVVGGGGGGGGVLGKIESYAQTTCLAYKKSKTRLFSRLLNLRVRCQIKKFFLILNFEEEKFSQIHNCETFVLPISISDCDFCSPISDFEDVFSRPAGFLSSTLGAVCAGVGGGREEGVCCAHRKVWHLTSSQARQMR